jgi:hypothetical protein
MRELIGGTNDKGVEGVFRIQSVFDGFEIESTLSRCVEFFSRRLFDDVNHIDVLEAGLSRGVENYIDVIVQPILKVLC